MKDDDDKLKHIKMQWLHSKRRAYQRYGFRLKKDEYERLCRKAGRRNKHRIFLSRDGNKTTALIRCRGQWVTVAFDESTQRICTFLPNEPQSK